MISASSNNVLCKNSSVSSSASTASAAMRSLSSPSSSNKSSPLNFASKTRDLAKDIAIKTIHKSTIFNVNAEADIPKIDSSELLLGRIMGRGGFCVVQEVSFINKSEKEENQVSSSSTKKKRTIVRKSSSSSLGRGNGKRKLKKLHTLDDISEVPHNTNKTPSEASVTTSTSTSTESSFISAKRSLTGRGQGRPARYVVKKLLPQEHLTEEENPAEMLLKGTVDLALEAKFLAALHHEHIIKLQGVSQCDPFQEGYFIVLEKLQETLTSKRKAWTVVNQASRGITGSLTRGKKKRHQVMVERLKVAHDIASAMGYLHNLNIIYRDLKPDNVGFDINGKVTIFDFGLVKQLHKDECQKDGTFRLTSFTGSVRYMAPEVGLGLSYNLSADIYSFGMVMWFLMALEPPFMSLRAEMWMEHVFQEGHRPALKYNWDNQISNLIKSCWHEDPKQRPDFGVIQETLKKQIQTVVTEKKVEAPFDKQNDKSTNKTTSSGMTSSPARAKQTFARKNKFAARQA